MRSKIYSRISYLLALRYIDFRRFRRKNLILQPGIQVSSPGTRIVVELSAEGLIERAMADDLIRIAKRMSR